MCNLVKFNKIIIVFFLLIYLIGCSGLGIKSIPLEKLENKYFNNASKYKKLKQDKQHLINKEHLINRVHIRDEGYKNKPVLFLIHGIVSALQTWDGWVRELKKDFRIVRLDLPGFGLTGPSANKKYSKEIWVETINNLAERLEIKHFSIAGNSLGGYVAWNYAIRYPDKIEKLILIDPIGYPQKMPFTLWFFSLPVFGEIGKLIIPRFIFAHNVSQVYGDQTKVTKEVIDFYYDMALRPGAIEAYITIFRLLRSRANDVNISQGIKEINCPTLLMWGNKDKWIPIELLKNWTKDLPHAKIKIYDGVGHVPMEEISKQTAKDAKLFLINN